jgi:uncharacterized protein involved in tolerance to divalent cations
MSTNHLQVFISAENKEQADNMLDSLLRKHLVSGGLITNGPSRFWWKGEITETNYFNISSFTTEKNKQAVIDDVKKNSVEEVPMVWFVNIDGNKEFLNWVEENVG